MIKLSICMGLALVVKKGYKDTIKEHATSQGESTNGFINRAIAEQIERDNDKTQKEKNSET